MRVKREFGPWDVFVLLLSIIGMAVVVAQSGSWLSSEAAQILDTADLLLCAVFFADFVREIKEADNRMRYLRTWGLVDLASSIPIIGPLRLARAGRIFRILRLLRAARSFKYIRHALMSHRAESAVLAACLWTFSLGVFASLTILTVEPPTSPINGADKALMWSFGTLTNSAPSHLHTISREADLLRTILAVSSAILFGIVTAGMADWFRRGATPIPAADRMTRDRA